MKKETNSRLMKTVARYGTTVGIILIIFLILFSAFLTKNSLQQTKKTEEMEKEKISKLIEYWEKIVAEKPDYRDGLFQLALLHYKLYENDKAKKYLQKSLELDPNFEPAREMEKILSD